MKVRIVQHVWHSKEAVFSLDFHPAGYLVTGGLDKTINIWDVTTDEDGSPIVTHLTDLQGHTKGVNCVRFSHSGHCLASSGDHGEIIIWKSAAPGAAPAFGASAAISHPGTPQTPGSAAKAAVVAAGPAAVAPVKTTAEGSAGSPRSTTPPLSPAGGAVDRSGSPPGTAGVASCCCWKQAGSLRGHGDDVMDLAWSHDDAVLMSGSVDNEVMMFDVDSRRNLARFANHRSFVQGVCWDPLGSFMVSCSQDRTVRIHTMKPPPSGSKSSKSGKSSAQLARDIIHTATLSKRTLPPPPATPPRDAPLPAAAAAAAAGDGHTAAAAAQPDQQQQQKPAQVYMFHDDSLETFFRRLAWSPDGSLLAVPAGLIRDDTGSSSSTSSNATYLFARGHWSSPLASLPCPAKASVAAKFCPLLFMLRSSNSSSNTNTNPNKQDATAPAGGGDGDGYAAAAAAAAGGGGGGEVSNVLGLPYRLVLAVATLDSVLLYDMQTLEPFLLVGPLHYSQITDLAWARDGSCLAVSSRDGYCSILTFKPGELGDQVTDSDLPAGLAAAMQQVAAQAAGTAAKTMASKGGVGVGISTAVTPVVSRPGSAGAGGSAAAAGGGGLAALTGGPSRPASASKQQQKAQVKRIQPQQVGSGTSPAAATVAAAAASLHQPRRISPSPVTAAVEAAAAPAGAAAAVAPRRVAPTPVAHTTAAAARCNDDVVDLTADEKGDKAAAAASELGRNGNRAPHQSSSSAQSMAKPVMAATAAAAAPKPRRVTPQPVAVPAAAAAGSKQQQQQQGGTPPPAAAAATLPAGRVGIAAIQAAAMAAAAKKQAAAKRAAETDAVAATEAGDAKKHKPSGQ